MEIRQVPCISGPCAKHLSVFGYGRNWDHLSLYGHMERIEIQNHSRNKVWDSEKDHRSLFAADLLCSWKFWKQPNGYSYKKCMATPCIENMEGFYFGQISDLTFRKGRFLVSEGSRTLKALKSLLEEISKWILLITFYCYFWFNFKVYEEIESVLTIPTIYISQLWQKWRYNTIRLTARFTELQCTIAYMFFVNSSFLCYKTPRLFTESHVHFRFLKWFYMVSVFCYFICGVGRICC